MPRHFLRDATRVSVSAGVAGPGGYPLIIHAQSTQLARGELIEHTTRVLDRRFAAIVWRTFGQERIEAMAVSRVPVVNALTEHLPPLPGPGRPADPEGAADLAPGARTRCPR